MDGPFVALQVIPGALAGGDLEAGQPEIDSARRLQMDPMAAPSEEKNSWPAISMLRVRVWILVRPVPSAWMVHMRSTRARCLHRQNMMRLGSVGENWRWPSHSCSRRMSFHWPVLVLTVKRTRGARGVAMRVL